MNAKRVLLAASCAAAFLACRSMRPVEVEPINLEASALFQGARAAIREGGPDARERAKASAAAALAASPGWVAPARLLDDLLVDDLLAVEALSSHRANLAESPQSGFYNYLAGRLEGVAGIDRFRRAVQLEPDLAWGHHGLAWSRAREGDFSDAVEHELAALQRARDGYERAFFSQALARFAQADDRAEEALAVLDRALRDPWLTQIDRIELELQAVEIELSLPSLARARAGYERGLLLLRRGDLTDAEVIAVALRLRRYYPLHDRDALELQLALASQDGAAADALRAELLLQSQPTPLALALLERSAARSGRPVAEVDATLLRQARFAAGAFDQALDLWLRDLPGQVLDSDGLPRAASLRSIADALARLNRQRGAAEIAQLGEALIAAGWFVEARSVAGELARTDLTGALTLDARALAGLELVTGIERLVASVDRGEGPFEVLQVSETSTRAPWEEEILEKRSDPRSLDGLLAAVAKLTERNPLLEGDPLAHQGSPRFDYGPIGELVHPGPLFSESDERAGLGKAGERVPGLARLCDAIGRFGLFGAMSGSAPDGTLLRTVLVEQRSGAHLGTPWSGTVAWCEGADLESRLGYSGATISGAALHEGYWVDLSIVRRQADSFADFQRRFAGAANAPRVKAAIESRGLRLTTPPGLLARRRLERRQVDPLLSEADRLRAAVLAERGGLPWSEGAPPLVPFEELVEITAIHEEGHLCDRGRFLPLRSNLGRALGLLFSAGFTPASVMARLEYRAELIALCSAVDPRLPLIDILRSAESAGDGTLPHPRAYRSLLADLLAVLDRELERHPESWSEIDRDRMLVHQLHWIPPEKLRRLAMELARDEGLVSRQDG